MPHVGENTSIYTGNLARLQCPIKYIIVLTWYIMYVYPFDFIIFSSLLFLVLLCSLYLLSLSVILSLYISVMVPYGK